MQQIQLQGIGRKNAIKVDDLEIGMHILYNYGASSEIVDIVPCGTQKRSVYTKDKNGQIWNRRYMRNRLIAVQEIQEG